MTGLEIFLIIFILLQIVVGIYLFLRITKLSTDKEFKVTELYKSS